MTHRGVFPLVLLVLLACGGGSSSGTGGNPGGSTSPDFSIAVSAPSPVQAGQSAGVSVTATLTGGESAALALAVASNAQGITGSGTLAAGATAGTLSLAVPAATGPGTYALSLTGTDGTRTHSAGFNLQVSAAQDPWAPVTAAIQAAQGQFPGVPGGPSGLTVEVMTPAGVVYSQSFGAFTNQTYGAVASASKWVSATAILRLVDAGILSLDSQAKQYLTDDGGAPWSGNMGEIKLRHLLSFTSGISGDDANDGASTLTLDQAVRAIYADDHATAQAPGSYFYYGDTHLRIAARMAEVATGKPWRQIFLEQVQGPLGWSAQSTFGNGSNPDPAGGLACTGLEYTRFMMMQLRQGLDGTNRLVQASTLAGQRSDGFGPGTTIAYSPYVALLNMTYHYGFGNWLETADGLPESATDPVVRWSSTGKFGWSPWVAADSAYAGVIMTQQPDNGHAVVPSDTLKDQLDPLIRTALAAGPPVIRNVP